MPELNVTPSELIDLFGRQLPTPEIDVIRIRDIPPDDEMYEQIAALAADAELQTDLAISRAEFDLMATTNRTSTGIGYEPDKMVRIDVDFTIRANTFEGFDPYELSREMFQTVTSTDGTDDESLYINLLVAKETGKITGLKESRLNLKSFVTPNDDFGTNWLQTSSLLSNSEIATGALDEYLMGQYLLEMIAGTQYYTVSLPLSNFFENVTLTTRFDTDNNAIISLSNMKVTAYLKNFTSTDNLTIFATISAGNPTTLGGRAPLSKMAYALNFSDVVYEDIIRNGSIATYGEDAFVDQAGTYYPNTPMRAISKKYYKTDSYGIPEILLSTENLMSEYRDYSLSNEEMMDALDMVNLALAKYSDDPRLLIRLNELGRAFPYGEDSKVALFGENFRILVTNMDSLLTEQAEVVRRRFKNYKIIDARSWEAPEMDATSYVEDYQVRDFLYDQIWGTNIANYVPIQEGGVDYPFKSELPYSPAERDEALRAKLEQIKKDINENLQVDYNQVGDDRFGSMGKLLKITQRVGEEMLDWIWYTWSSRWFSFYTLYGNSSQHSGFQAVIAKSGVEVGQPYKYYGCWKNMCEDNAPTSGCPYGKKVMFESLKEYVTRFTDSSKGKGGFAEAFNIIDPDDHLSFHRSSGYSPSADTGGTYRSGNDAGESVMLSEFGAPTDPAIYSGRNGASGCEKSHYMGPYLYHEATRGELFSIKKWLVDEPHQLQLYLPKTKTGPDGGRYPVESHYASEADLTYTGGMGQAMGTLQQWLEESVELIGGINPIDAVELLDSAQYGAYWHGYAYDISERSDIGNDDWDLWEMPAGLVLRRRFKNQILAQIDELLASVLGLHAAGPGWTEHEYDTTAALDLSEDQRSDEYSWGDFALNLYGLDQSQPLTTSKIDDYLATLPSAVVNSCVSDMFDSLTALDTSRLETPAQRDNWTVSYLEGFYNNLERHLEKYVSDSGILSFWLVNAVPTNNGIGNIPAYSYWETRHGHTYGAYNSQVDDPDGNPVGDIAYACSVKWTPSRYLANLDGESVYGKCLYGDWGPAQRLQNFHRDSADRGGVKRDSNGNPWSDRSAKYQCFNMANEVTEYLWAEWTSESRVSKMRSLVREYIDVIAAHQGVTMDTGVCSALSEVDIVVKKYGYFFFDMEKFIRKSSYMSRYMNVDRFLNNVQAGKELTNAAVNIHQVSYNNRVPYGGGYKGVILKLLGPSDMSEQAFGYDWSVLTFDTSFGGVDKPYAYNKISPLQNIDFNSITKWTNDSQGYPGGSDLEDASVRFEGNKGLLQSVHAPTNEYSYLVQRQYGFMGFNDLELGSGKTWRDDYRLMCFNFQYYVDDDVALRETPLNGTSDERTVTYEHWEQAMPGDTTVDIYGNDKYDLNAPLDSVKLSVILKDNTFEVMQSMIQWFTGLHSLFEEKYVEKAKEACTFDDFTYKFNNFFIEEMLLVYPDPATSPWFQMTSAYVLMLNIFTDTFGGLNSEMIKAANNTIEQIRPETGTLDALIEWDQAVKTVIERLENMLAEAQAEYGPEDSNRYFLVNVEEQNIIIDHVGNYVQESGDVSFNVD